MASLELVTRTPKISNAANHALKPSSKNARSKIDNTLANASSCLAMAKELAPLAPVPFLSGIIGTAQSIVDAARGVRQNRTDCAELARRVAELTQDINRQIHGHEDIVDASLAAALDGFRQQLVEIEQFMLDHTSQKLISRIIQRGSVSVRIVELTSKLNHAMQAFKTISNVRLEIQMIQLKRSLEACKNIIAGDRKYDGQFRIYRRADVCLTAKRHVRQICDGSSEEYYEGTIDGRAVAVKIYRDCPKKFNEALDALKHVWHPNVAQLEGYSQDDCHSFVVLKTVRFPLRKHILSLTVRDTMIFILKSIAIYTDVELYLRDRGLTCLDPSTQFMLDARCEPHFEAHRRPKPSDGWPKIRTEYPSNASISYMINLIGQPPHCHEQYTAFRSDCNVDDPSKYAFNVVDFLELRDASSTLHQGLSQLKRQAADRQGFLAVLRAFVDLFSHITPIADYPTWPSPMVIAGESHWIVHLKGLGSFELPDQVPPGDHCPEKSASFHRRQGLWKGSGDFAHVMKDRRWRALAFLCAPGVSLAVRYDIGLLNIAVELFVDCEIIQPSFGPSHPVKLREEIRLTPALARLLRTMWTLQVGLPEDSLALY